MKVKFKKIVAVLFAVVIIFAANAQVAFAQGEETFDITYTANVGDRVNPADIVSSDYKNDTLVAKADESDIAQIKDGEIYCKKAGIIYICIECYRAQSPIEATDETVTDGTSTDESTTDQNTTDNTQTEETLVAIFNVTFGVNAKKQKKIDYSDVLPYCKSIAKMSEEKSNVKRTVYGRSVMGKPLEAYEIYNASKHNSYKKTLFIDFAVHGFEDEYYRDGKVLVKEAVKLVQYFAEHSSKLKNYRLVIVVCANPDGTFDGKNNSRANSRAFGRCTAKHVDINRDFRKFKGKQTRALKNYILKTDPDIYLNCHGWENQVIGTRKLNKIVKNNLHVRRTQNGVYCYSKGFVIGWVHKKLGIPVALVEYKNTSSVSTTKDTKMIKDIINAY